MGETLLLKLAWCIYTYLHYKNILCLARGKLEYWPKSDSSVFSYHVLAVLQAFVTYDACFLKDKARNKSNLFASVYTHTHIYKSHTYTHIYKSLQLCLTIHLTQSNGLVCLSRIFKALCSPSPEIKLTESISQWLLALQALRSCLAWIPAVLLSSACQFQKKVRIKPLLTRDPIPQMCCSYTKNQCTPQRWLWVPHWLLGAHRSLQAVEVTQSKPTADERYLHWIQDLGWESQNYFISISSLLSRLKTHSA